MIPIKNAENSAEKFVTRAQASTGFYEQGVLNPKVAWDVAAGAAEGNFEAGIQNAIAKKRFGKGIKLAGNAKYQKGVTEKGVQRYGTGISVAKAAYQVGIAPFLSTIGGLTLPPKGPKGSNINRVSIINTALMKKKDELMK